MTRGYFTGGEGGQRLDKGDNDPTGRCLRLSLGLPLRGRWCLSGFFHEPTIVPRPAAVGGPSQEASRGGVPTRKGTARRASPQSRDLSTPARPHPEKLVLKKKKETGSAVAAGDFEEALAVYFRLWGKVVAVPGPLPAPSPHRREKPASPRLQEGGDRGP